MDLDQASGTTTAFYTLHSCDGDIAMAVSEILRLADEHKNDAWQSLLESSPSLKSRLQEQGLTEPFSIDKIAWDDAMLLFLCAINIDEEGKPMAIGESLKRERFGRFPYGDGSLVNYLIEFLRPNSRVNDQGKLFGRMIDLLKKMSSFNHIEDYNLARYDGGMGGMNILGFLSLEEVSEMRKLLAGRNWSVASDEPLDGGVRDAVKHLLAMIRAAERIDSGVIHRAHM